MADNIFAFLHLALWAFGLGALLWLVWMFIDTARRVDVDKDGNQFVWKRKAFLERKKLEGKR